MKLKELMNQEDIHLQKLSELVKEAIAEEELLSSKLLEIEQDTDATFGQRVADRVATFGGSWTFIIIFFALLFGWIAINAWVMTNKPFDPYPFILLNLILSCLASIQAPIIMMSQNRREEKDRRRAKGDYLINLKAEMEIRSLQSKVDLLISEEMKTLFALQESQVKMLQRIEKAVAK